MSDEVEKTAYEFRFMVSFQYNLYPDNCGNTTFTTKQEALEYIKQNRLKWKYYTLFTYEPSPYISQLTEISEEGD